MAIIQKNTIRDEGSTALYAAYTVGTVYTVNNVDTVYKHKYCFNCLMHHICEKRYSQNGVYGNDYKDTRNCQEKVKKISHLKPNQLAPSIYIMKVLCFFSLDQ